MIAHSKVKLGEPLRGTQNAKRGPRAPRLTGARSSTTGPPTPSTPTRKNPGAVGKRPLTPPKGWPPYSRVGVFVLSPRDPRGTVKTRQRNRRSEGRVSTGGTGL